MFPTTYSWTLPLTAALLWSRYSNMPKKRRSLLRFSLRRWGPRSVSYWLYQPLAVGYIWYRLKIYSNMSSSCLRTLRNVQGQAPKMCLDLPWRACNKGTIEEACTCPISVYMSHEPLHVYLRLLERHRCHSLTMILDERPDSSFTSALCFHRPYIPSGYAFAYYPDKPRWVMAKTSVCLHVPGMLMNFLVNVSEVRQLALAYIWSKYHAYIDM